MHYEGLALIMTFNSCLVFNIVQICNVKGFNCHLIIVNNKRIESTVRSTEVRKNRNYSNENKLRIYKLSIKT